MSLVGLITAQISIFWRGMVWDLGLVLGYSKLYFTTKPPWGG